MVYAPFKMTGGVSGKPKNIYSTREENLKKKQWLRNQITSKRNREIIKEELTKERRTKAGGVISALPTEKEIDEVVNARLRNLSTVSVEVTDEPIGKTWGSTYGLYTPEKEGQIKNLQEYYKSRYNEDITIEEAEEIWKTSEHEYGKDKEHHIKLQPQQDYRYQDINLEEYLHAVKGGPKVKGDLPEKTAELIDKHAKGGAGSKYETVPHEFSAQTNIVKYIIGETTDYDPTKDVFTEEDYNEIFNKDNFRLQNSIHLQRFMKSLKVNYNKKGES